MADIVIEKIIDADIPPVKELLRQYLAWLNIDLSFQNIEEELAGFPGKYKEPDGIFFTARLNNEIAGCIGLRKIDGETCEMKRLFVKDEYKGKGLGKALAERLIQEAKKLNYSKMRLDTLPHMTAAQKLYKELGFYEIEQYVENPVPGAIFMEKELT